MIESLELRTLFSALPAPLDPTLSLPAQSAAVHAVQGPPVLHSSTKLHLVAGVPFTGQLGFYASPVLDPPLAYSASIDWGDGNTSAATLQYGVQGSTGGYQIIGSHTYSKAGRFKIEITFTSGPIAEPGEPIALPIRLIETIIEKAVVSPAYQNSAGGVTIGQVAGESFTADLGSFSTIAPGTDLHATISWGDGTTSKGTLIPAGVTGLDVLQFTVSGTHIYAQPGAYPIHVTISRRGTGASHISLIISTATVTSASGVDPSPGKITAAIKTGLTATDANESLFVLA